MSHPETDERVRLVVVGEDHEVDPQEEADLLAFGWDLSNRLLHPENFTTPDPSLNVGCGDDYFRLPGWINFDLNALPGWHLDLVASMFDLPFGDDTCARAYVGHVLEHVPYADAPAALREIHRVLKPGGELLVVGPALDLAEAINAPQWLIDDIKEHVGNDDGLGHQWTATSTNTLDLVRSVFPRADFIPLGETGLRDGWPNRNTLPTSRWQVAVLAVVE